ncbi:MAG: hypothetical protein AB8B53_11880, partial [Flavobacteriales bacterium]
MLRCCFVAFLTTLTVGAFGQDSPTLTCDPVTIGLGSDGFAVVPITTYGLEVEAFDDCGIFSYDIEFPTLAPSSFSLITGIFGQTTGTVFNCEALGANDFILSTNCVDFLGSDNDITDACTESVSVQDLIAPLICIGDVTIECNLDNGAAPLPFAGWAGSATQADFAGDNYSFPITSAIDFIGASNNIPVAGDCPDVSSIDEAAGYTGLPYVEENDECGGFTVTYSDELVGYSALEFECENHSYTINRTWTATDASGNSNSVVQVITVEDTTAPEFDLAPGDLDVVVECDAFMAGDPTTLTATDNCYLASVTLFSDNTGNPVAAAPGTTVMVDGEEVCVAFTAQRTWMAEDACGNMQSFTQTFTLIDTTGPVLETAFVNGQEIPVEPGTGSDFLIDLFDAYDDQEIPVGDNCLAEIEFDLPFTDSCQDVEISWILGLVDETGNNEIDAGTGSVYTGSLGKGFYSLIYEVEDACGNFAGSPINFTVIDDTQAQVNFPTDIIASTSQQTGNDANGCRVRRNQLPGFQMEYVPFSTLNPAGPGEFTDNCPITSFTWSLAGASTTANPVVVMNPTVGAFYPANNFWLNKGETEVTYTIVDCSGASQTETFTVTILDDEPAEITCPTVPPVLSTSD